MADILSQGEVESLLAALDPGSGAETAGKLGGGLSRISVYDFKRPERVSKEQMRAFHALHEGFSREFGAALSGMLRTIVETKLISVDQLTYSEFAFSLENPTCFNLMMSEGLGGHLILDLNPSILFPILDRLLGGGRHARIEIPRRPLTDIELRLVGRITGLVTRGLEAAWANICDLQLSVTQIESNPQLVQIVPPNEVIVLSSFEIAIGDLRGLMNLCIPYITIEPMMGEISADTWSSHTKREVDPQQRRDLEASIKRAGVEMVVRLAETRISAGELATLAVGDVITTEKDAAASLDVRVEDRPTFTAYPGLYKGRKAIRIGDAVAPLDEVVSAEPAD